MKLDKEKNIVVQYSTTIVWEMLIFLNKFAFLQVEQIFVITRGDFLSSFSRHSIIKFIQIAL